MKLFVNISLLLFQFQSLLRKLLTVVALRLIILSFERNMFKAQVQDLLGRQSLCAATYIFSNIFFLISSNLPMMVNGHKKCLCLETFLSKQC